MVDECRVRLDTTLPEPRLHALIVPKGAAADEVVIAACDHWARRNFNAPERPISFEVTLSLP